MNQLIINFISRNQKNLDEHSKSYRMYLGQLSAVVGIASNIVLFLIKLGVGLSINSISVISDSFNNLSDTFASLVSFYGIKTASKPADKEHPFGHGRGEYIAALVVAFFILLVGWEFIQTSIRKILNHDTILFSYLTLALLILSILVKIWQYTFNMYVGKKINSKVLILTARDSLNDVVITSLTVISILVTKFTGFVIDGYVGVLLSCVLIWQGYELIKDTISPLLGEACDKELAMAIRSFINKYDEVIGTHDLIVHNYGPNINVCTIHVELDKNLDFNKAHDIIDTIEASIQEEMNIMLTVHIDPIDVDNKELEKIKKVIQNLIEIEKVDFYPHDFRIVNMEGRMNIIFELEIPYKYDMKNAEKFKVLCCKEIKAVNESYSCIINIEHSFVL